MKINSLFSCGFLRLWQSHLVTASGTEHKPTATMNITITSKAVNNGKQHVLRIPFIGTFTVDQKDASRAILFVLANGKNESIGFMNAIAIR
jgi:hypothetical protein